MTSSMQGKISGYLPRSDIRIFKDGLSTVGEPRNPEDIGVEEMNMHLTRFFFRSMQDKISGYLPRALIWIVHFFIYHICKKIRFTYKYVITNIINNIFNLDIAVFIRLFCPASMMSL
jgi:hypothetical protein